MNEQNYIRAQTEPLIASQLAHNPDLKNWLLRLHLKGEPLPVSWPVGGGTAEGETLLSVGE